MKSMIRRVVLSLLFLPATLFGWGNGTHVYFVNQLGAERMGANAHEMYGSVLADAFNYVLDPAGRFMADQLHHNPMALYNIARGCGRTSTAFGFVSHNDTWGADYTAHHDSRMVPGTGYAILKGTALAPTLVPEIVAILVGAGIDAPTAGAIAAAIAPEFGHDLAETAVDLLVKRTLDPAIGLRLRHAARTRPASVPLALAEAYAGPLASYAGIPRPQAAGLILAVEREYRNQMIQYGGILMLPEPQAIEAFAYVSAGAAELFLENASGVDVSVPPAVVGGFLIAALAAVEPDFQPELAGTLTYLRAELTARGITSCGSLPRPGTETAEADALPAEFSLEGNYPNPFNPSTTIAFSIPTAAPVSLVVYNMLGQTVRTLLGDVTCEAGRHQAVWDARDDSGSLVPSGTYVYRLSAPGGSAVGKMTLLK